MILGDAPPLTPAEQLYQRLLADDPVEAAEQAERYLKDRTLTQYYDEVLVPGMEKAQADSDAGRLARGRLDDLRAAATILVEAVADLPIRTAENGIAAPSLPSAEWQTEGAVVLIAGQSPLDELCTGVLAQQLAQDGFSPHVMTAAEIASAQLQGREFAGVKLVCLVMLNVERRGPYLKLIARRLLRLFPDVRRVGAFWGREKGEARVLELSPDLGLQPLTASLEETLTLCRRLGWQAQTGPTG